MDTIYKSLFVRPILIVAILCVCMCMCVLHPLNRKVLKIRMVYSHYFILSTYLVSEICYSEYFGITWLDFTFGNISSEISGIFKVV